MSKNERIMVRIAGIVIGTADGWDDSDFLAHVYYDFYPAPTVDLPAGDLFLAYDSGNFEVYDPLEGKIYLSGNIMSVLLKSLDTDD